MDTEALTTYIKENLEPHYSGSGDLDTVSRTLAEGIEQAEARHGDIYSTTDIASIFDAARGRGALEPALEQGGFHRLFDLGVRADVAVQYFEEAGIDDLTGFVKGDNAVLYSLAAESRNYELRAEETKVSNAQRSARNWKFGAVIGSVAAASIGAYVGMTHLAPEASDGSTSPAPVVVSLDDTCEDVADCSAYTSQLRELDHFQRALNAYRAGGDEGLSAELDTIAGERGGAMVLFDYNGTQSDGTDDHVSIENLLWTRGQSSVPKAKDVADLEAAIKRLGGDTKTLVWYE